MQNGSKVGDQHVAAGSHLVDWMPAAMLDASSKDARIAIKRCVTSEDTSVGRQRHPVCVSGGRRNGRIGRAKTVHLGQLSRISRGQDMSQVEAFTGILQSKRCDELALCAQACIPTGMRVCKPRAGGLHDHDLVSVKFLAD
jgi:hypothetical protein